MGYFTVFVWVEEASSLGILAGVEQGCAIKHPESGDFKVVNY